MCRWGGACDRGHVAGRGHTQQWQHNCGTQQWHVLHLREPWCLGLQQRQECNATCCRAMQHRMQAIL